MTRILLLLTATFFVFNVSIAQEPAVATLHYTLQHVIDSTQPEAPLKTDMILYLGKTSSMFTSYDEMQKDERMKNFLLTHPDVKLGGSTSYFGAPISFYKDMAATKLSSISLFKGNHYLVEEKMPEIKWDISSETKIIQGYTCQKATASFHGRTYEAWFCSQLPFNNGPWKLGGLPGLILEASDAKKEVIFTFKSFEDTSHTQIILTDNTIKTTNKELSRTIEASQSGAPGTGGGGGGGGMVATQSSSNGAPAKRRQYNNPIDKEQ